MILYELQHPRGSGVVPFKLDSNSGAIIVSGPLRRGRIAVFVEASDQVCWFKKITTEISGLCKRRPVHF